MAIAAGGTRLALPSFSVGSIEWWWKVSPTDASVLIVEDERVSRNALKAILTDHGYNTKAFASAEELLSEVEKTHTKPQAVLADVDLPGMSGLELLAHLERKFPDLYAVVITAADGDTIQSFCEKHPFAYLPKPLNLARLLSLLEDPQNRNPDLRCSRQMPI